MVAVYTWTTTDAPVAGDTAEAIATTNCDGAGARGSNCGSVRAEATEVEEIHMSNRSNASTTSEEAAGEEVVETEERAVGLKS